MRRRGNFKARVERRIDRWGFRQPYVKDGEPGDQMTAVYNVYIKRGGVQSDDGAVPKFKFRAIIDEKDTSTEIFQLKGKIWIEADTLEALREKCEADFNSYGLQDWKKVILVAIHRPGTHKNEGKESALHFGYAVLETTGGRYRTTDDRSYVSRDKEWLIEGEAEEIVELPYTEELEAKLAQVKGALDLLAERLTEVVADPKKLLSTKFPQLLK
jgi:hypothetical protein